MNKITSTTNEKIKEYSKLQQKKYRDKSDLFIVEGVKSYDELISAKIKIKEVFILDTAINKIEISEVQTTLCNEAVMKKLSSTDSTPIVVTIAYKKHTLLEDCRNNSTIALFENIKDPGNLGTIIRSAAAFNINSIILFGETVDLYNPKTIRAAAGNFFKIPIIEIKQLCEIKTLFNDFDVISTSLSSKKDYDFNTSTKHSKKLILFGSEADGLSKELEDLASFNYKIGMNENVESLNLSVAASIIFYEVYKSSF